VLILKGFNGDYVFDTEQLCGMEIVAGFLVLEW